MLLILKKIHTLLNKNIFDREKQNQFCKIKSNNHIAGQYSQFYKETSAFLKNKKDNMVLFKNFYIVY